ncbi:hypothetical protein BGZ49_004700 [Haplosporangium sp. Z 27]|nr:hypothetical protein BGZ49_004700 [Haplosporangium sp. Z 27]
MDPFFSLILLCLAMLLASFLAGNVPLSFHLSEDRLKLISNFGVGLLVGTSLVVIIPEGVETLYSVPKTSGTSPSTSGGTAHNSPIKRSYIHPDLAASGLTLTSSFKNIAANAGLIKRDSEVVMNPSPAYVIKDQFIKDSLPPSSFEDNMLMTRRADKTVDNAVFVKRQELEDDETETEPGDDNENQDLPNNDNEELGHGPDEEEKEEDAHRYIGLALLSGFILMFLIDQMGPSHAHSHNNHVSVADFTELHNLQLDDNNIRMPSAAGMNVGAGKRRGNPITIGLVVHAAADGIALGASASRPELRFIVFLAIMLHKAPAAFGLSTVLLQHGFSRRQTRQQVGIFSFAAPIGALLTYVFIQMSGHRDEASLHWWTGMLLLFSGGTFLYVAMHVMSEMNNPEKSSGSSGYVGGGVEKGLSIVDVLCVIGGMVVPLILSVDHEH